MPQPLPKNAGPQAAQSIPIPYHQCFETFPEAVLLLCDGRVAGSNPAAARLFGRGAEQLQGLSPLDLSPERQIDGSLSSEAARHKLRLAAAGIRQTFRWRHLHVDGTPRESEVQLLPMPDAGPSAVMAVVRDVHAQRRAEDDYRSIFVHSGSPSVIVDDDMTILMANPKFEQLLGYPRAELEGRMTWADIVHPDERERMQGYHRQRRRPGGTAPAEYECRFVDHQGNAKVILLKVGMLPDGRRSILSLTDITAHKAAEQELRRQQKELSAIVEATGSLIYTCDREYTVGFMNRPMIARNGRDGRGEKCYAVLHDRQAPCPWCPNEQVFAGESVYAEVQSPKDGRWLYGINSPVLGADGQVAFKQAVIIDITERKEAETRLQENAAHLREEVRRLRAGVRDRFRFGDLVGKSAAMQAVYDLILNAAGSDANAIIYGESGTGKELVARAIHAASDRRSHPFVPVNCGAIPENLIESEFFGYKKGAFSGAMADKHGLLDAARGGTLFLDELGDLALRMQVKLLRAIEGGGYTPVGGQQVRHTDARIIAATNRDLEAMVASGRFRQDLYYRVHVIPIRLPPLRERREDLPLLAEHFLQRCSGGRPAASLDGRLLDRLAAYDWPGNVRELENVLRRFVTLGRIDLGDRRQAAGGPPPATARDGAPEGRLKDRVEAFERQLIVETLEACRWHKAKAAARLGIHRKTLFTKLRQYGLES